MRNLFAYRPPLMRKFLWHFDGEPPSCVLYTPNLFTNWQELLFCHRWKWLRRPPTDSWFRGSLYLPHTEKEHKERRKRGSHLGCVSQRQLIKYSLLYLVLFFVFSIFWVPYVRCLLTVVCVGTALCFWIYYSIDTKDDSLWWDSPEVVPHPLVACPYLIR